jgi:hypothetical protein
VNGFDLGDVCEGTVTEDIETRDSLWEQYAVVASLADLCVRVILLSKHTEAGREARHQQTSSEVLGIRKSHGKIDLGFYLDVVLLLAFQASGHL